MRSASAPIAGANSREHSSIRHQQDNRADRGDGADGGRCRQQSSVARPVEAAQPHNAVGADSVRALDIRVKSQLFGALTLLFPDTANAAGLAHGHLPIRGCVIESRHYYTPVEHVSGQIHHWLHARPAARRTLDVAAIADPLLPIRRFARDSPIIEHMSKISDFQLDCVAASGYAAGRLSQGAQGRHFHSAGCVQEVKGQGPQ